MIQPPVRRRFPMSRLEVPLRHRTLRTTGDTVLWADLILSLKSHPGDWKELPFPSESIPGPK